MTAALTDSYLVDLAQMSTAGGQYRLVWKPTYKLLLFGVI